MASVDVLYDVGATIKAQSAGTGFVIWLHEHKFDAVADFLIAVKMKLSPGIRWGVNNTRWVTGVSTLSQTPEAFDAYSLANIAGRIYCDVLILAGSKDHLVPAVQVEQFRSSLTHARSVITVIYDAESGGKDHCQDGAVTLWQQTFFDWIHNKFEPQKNVQEKKTPAQL